jgi:hypothetical protein
MEYNIYPLRCQCGYVYGIGVGVPRGHRNRHCFNENCENSFQQKHPNGYNRNDCCRVHIEDEGVSL